jgi:phage terminase large subunit GpA-like protein
MNLKSPKIARKRFLQSLYPRERWAPSEWAERERVLSAEESDEPGPYRFDRTPYWRFVCDLVARPGIEEVVCLKGAQIGWSELCRNVMGYWIDMKPGPCMVLMPDRESAKSFREERMEPLMTHTPAISRYVSERAWDAKKTSIRFTNSMRVFFVWAGSKTGTKSRPIRYLICEEPDEYPAFSSTAGDPLSKAEKRLTTARAKGMARMLIGGTPTTRMGNTHKRWEMCPVRYHCWLPCPHCNGYQMLVWKQVGYEKALPDEDRARHAERIKSNGLAWYECEHCKQKIRDHHKPRMLNRGIWATEDQAVTVDGRVVGPEKRANRVGVKVSSLYSPWVYFPTLAAEWIESQGDPNALADFINQRLAETFEEERAKTEPEFLEERAKGSPEPLIVPKWTMRLLATADTQGLTEQDGHFWYVIRAWAYDYRSQLVDFGVCHSKQELFDRIFNRPLQVEGTDIKAVPSFLLIDAGGPRWNEVCNFAKTDPRIHASQGSPYTRNFMANEKPYPKHGIVLWEIDTTQTKDKLHELIHDPDRGRWAVNSGINRDYCRQISAERKIHDPSKNMAVWTPVPAHEPNHLGDCEANQVAAAFRCGLGTSAPQQEETPVQTQSDIATFGGKGRW